MDISEERRSASRANGSKSRGPVSISGKVNSSRNGFRNQFLSGALLLNGESPELLDQLLASLDREFRPQSGLERMLLETVAASRWRQIRSWSLETAASAALACRSLADSSRTLGQITRTEARYDRQYNRALQRLLALHANGTKTTPGIVAPDNVAA